MDKFKNNSTIKCVDEKASKMTSRKIRTVSRADIENIAPEIERLKLSC